VRRVTKGLSALSDRTPLRTKLITALLTLVIMALAAISVTSDFVLRSYLTTRYDNAVRTFFDAASARPQEILSGYLPGVAYPFNANAVIGIQLDGKPLVPPSGNVPGNGIIGNQQNLAVPSVPATQSWAIANADKLVTVGSSTGRELWRVMTEPITYNDNTPATLVVAFGLGNVNQEIGQLVLVELIVGAAIVVVLAAVGVGVVQANLRSLNDIEMTAGQIAKGHLNHRIPERDPRTEIGSLGHSLNACAGSSPTPATSFAPRSPRSAGSPSTTGNGEDYPERTTAPLQRPLAPPRASAATTSTGSCSAWNPRPPGWAS
jgi:two-component system OmpR family sensor kinase